MQSPMWQTNKPSIQLINQLHNQFMHLNVSIWWETNQPINHPSNQQTN